MRRLPSFPYRHLQSLSRRPLPLARTVGIAMVAALVVAGPQTVRAQVYTFTTLANFNNGNGPIGNLTLDSNGNLYGTTYASGTSSDTIFEFANGGTAANPAYGTTPDTLVSFTQAQPSGYNPVGGLAIDGQGDLFGVAGNAGGSSDYAYEYINTGTITNPNYGTSLVSLGTIPSYDGTTNTPLANGGLILDSNGNLYGTTANGTGTVYVIANSGTATNPVYNTPPTTITTVEGNEGPNAGLTMDARGDLFGTSFAGGPNGGGSVFELTNTGTVAHPVYSNTPNYLVSFAPGASNGNPASKLTLDSHGNLFGESLNGNGSVFEIANTGTASNPVYANSATTVALFNGDNAADNGLTIDSAGNIFGTSFAGGTNGAYEGVGTVFKIANIGTVNNPSYGSLQTLVNFNGTNGGDPRGPLIIGSNGTIYGTTEDYGANYGGTLFSLTANPSNTWNGLGSDNNWNTNANWIGATAPGPTANADIIFDGTTRLNPNLEQPYSVDSVSFAASAGAFTLGGSTLTIGANGILQNSATNLQTIATNGVVLGAAQTWSVAAGGLTVSAPISGGGALTITGPGKVTLTGSNSYSGGTTINAGNVQVGGGTTNTSSLGTGDVTITNNSAVLFTAASSAGSANINVNDTSTLTFQNSANAGTSNITVGGTTGSVTFTGAATAGNSTINSNGSATIINFVGNSTAENATIYNESQGGYLQFGQNATAGNANIISTALILVENSATLGSAQINSSGAGGSIDLSTDASGATIINNGGSGSDFGGVDTSNPSTLSIGIGSLSGSGNVYLGSNTLTLGALGKNDTISGTIADGGGYGGTGGSLVKVGSGTLTLSGANTYTGTTTVNAGRLIITGAGTYGTVISNADGADVDISGGSVSYSRSLYLGVTNIFSGTVDIADSSAGGKLNVFGGTVNHVIVGDPATVNIYGGQFSSSIENDDPTQSVVNIFGSDFTLTDATINGGDVDWLLQGTLQDGETLDTEYIESGDDTTSAQGIAFNPTATDAAPEPAALSLVLAGVGAIGVGIRRKRQSSTTSTNA